MRSLFWKGMLAFLAVILAAVGTVALLSGWVTEIEFRRYASSHGGIWDRQAADLAAYYAEHDSWEGIQDTLQPARGAGQQGQGKGRGGAGPPGFDFRVANSDGRVVGDTESASGGTVSQAELEYSIPIEVEGRIAGYLLPSPQTATALPLDAPQAQFLARVRAALGIAALAALAAALIIGGLLFRSIVAPLRRLTTASQAIAQGDLSTRAPAQGRDEVAQLADAFNQMAESLARAEEARQNQTADVAHELRTPLTVLQGALEAMLDGVYPTDRENLLAALAQVRTLARLVEDLRLLALADAGQLHLDIAPLDLGAFLGEVVEAHRLQAQERKVDLTLERPPALPLVQADRDRLAQVMGNLLSNGLRYVAEGGHIAVRVTDQGQEVMVAVADDGPGIPPEDIPHLFERFWRGDPARRRATGGSGLGLAIARSLIEAHGGRLRAESVEGQGSTFTFTLPISSQEGWAATPGVEG
jgi:two-component system sensor histidine kinase BaeS